ncbi:hypothetical protein BDV25DRAFT_169091 [Aspergillus avenaceus]|uniref:UBC core domain-containing protein n=1 Tax=Aspergillus avenaceus TaxID=36643 RepID=A0A5N6TMI1_ASPAV|nr:hypothetical protein BDV25DRAFT_169091 [Aspergillus avenaceus]
MDSHEPLKETLIISYTSVPERELTGFLKTGVPPKGYVFVDFAEPSQGSSLIHEDDLVLIDRTLRLGDTVKRHPNDTLSGIVTSTSATCSLEPIAYRTLDSGTGEYGPIQFTEKPIKRNAPVDEIVDTIKPPMLHNVPLSDLKNFEEYSEGDYIIHRQKLGFIQRIDRDAVLLLPNQKTVSPLDPGALELLFTCELNDLLALPTNMKNMKSYPQAEGGFIWSAEADVVYPGQFTFTSRNNLSRGDLSSSADPNSDLEGHVIATPPMSVHINWLCPNVFASGSPHKDGTTSREVIRASALHGNSSTCDFGKVPHEASGQQSVKSDSWIGIRDRVRFRDPIAAAARYPVYQQIPANQSCGYDINILRIISTKTEATVQWQDGTITTEAATEIHRFLGTEEEVRPGCLVALKDGVETHHEPCRHTTGPLGYHMNESIRLKKAGIVQTVDSRERLAYVRWYESPNVELMHRGNVVTPGSSLGELCDAVTKVSIYELSSYPSMERHLDDLVLLAPEKVHQTSMPVSDQPPIIAAGPCKLSFLSPMTFSETGIYLDSIKRKMVQSDWFKKTTEIDTSPIPSRFSMHHDEYSMKSLSNFIGKIVSIGTDGVITVRLAGVENCRDIRVPWERIMMVIDEDEALPPLPPLELLSLADISTGSAEDEESDFNDSDSGDDEWTTEDGSGPDDRGYEVIENNIDEHDNSTAPAVIEISPLEGLNSDQKGALDSSDSQIKHTSKGGELNILTLPMPSSCPPGFSFLGDSPPPDHHFLSQIPMGNSTLCFRRVQKEFDILRCSLPAGIFVRTWESRMDLLRVLILGPRGTPYEHAPFVIDFYFSDEFPNKPPAAFFHSWTNRYGMINPNLQEDGGICLSLLDTWPGKNPTERWSPNNSTILQVLVSIMGLVLVKEPFYNEAGYEALAVAGDRRLESGQYTEKVFLMTRKFIQHALEHPVSGLEDVLAWHYLSGMTPKDKDHHGPRLLRQAIHEALDMIEHHNRTSSDEVLGEEHAASAFVTRLSMGAVVMLRKHIAALEHIESAAKARINS